MSDSTKPRRFSADAITAPLCHAPFRRIWLVDLLRFRYCWRMRHAPVGSTTSLVNAD